MELFLWEHKRLWKRKSTQISVLLCLLYVVVFGSILSYQWFTFGSRTGYDNFSKQFDGYTNIRLYQQYARQFGGVLTDEALQEMVRDYQAIAEVDYQNSNLTNVCDQLLAVPTLSGSETSRGLPADERLCGAGGADRLL